MKKFLIILFTFSIMFGFFIKGNTCFAANAKTDSFNLNTLFTNDHISVEKKGINSFEDAIGAIVRAITGLIGGTAVLGTILGGFLILTSGGSDDGMNKGKKIIMYSLIGIAVSLISYTMIQLLQIFLFSFE